VRVRNVPGICPHDTAQHCPVAKNLAQMSGSMQNTRGLCRTARHRTDYCGLVAEKYFTTADRIQDMFSFCKLTLTLALTLSLSQY